MADRVLGVLGGADMPDDQLRAWAESSDALYAADSGANRLVRMGLAPVVVGDLDSVDTRLIEGLRIVNDANPDRTDCDKMLALIVSEGHLSVTVAGIEGDLFDHMLASLSSLVRSTLKVRLALRTGIAHLLRGGDDLHFPGAFGRRVSLIPLSHSTGVTLRGVLWEVEEAVMEPAGFLSVSNEGTGDVTASLRTGSALLFVGRKPTESPLW